MFRPPSLKGLGLTVFLGIDLLQFKGHEPVAERRDVPAADECEGRGDVSDVSRAQLEREGDLGGSHRGIGRGHQRGLKLEAPGGALLEAHATLLRHGVVAGLRAPQGAGSIITRHQYPGITDVGAGVARLEGGTEVGEARASLPLLIEIVDARLTIETDGRVALQVGLRDEARKGAVGVVLGVRGD
ncbi:MAG: hypothetical protein ABIO70_33135 [Pseudomonadota bacterium]